MLCVASLALAEAAARSWDVIVTGAGPAGVVAARELARQGAAVLLVDKAAFPRGKVCGGCFNQRALATLHSLGLEAGLAPQGAVPLQRMRLATQGRCAEFPLPGGVALSRETFDAMLVEAATEAGVAFLPTTEARAEGCHTDHRWLTLRQGTLTVTVSTRLLLVADGLGGGVLHQEPSLHRQIEPHSRLGAGVLLSQAPESFPPGILFMACGRGGYVGAVRVEGGRLNLAAALDPAWVKSQGGLGCAALAILQAAGFPVPMDLADAPWRGTPLLTRRLLHPYAERVFVLGDAAGYVEPFTGEGMAWALASGVAVVPLAIQAVQGWREILGRRWELTHRRLVRERQRVIRIAAQVLRQPRLTAAVVSLLQYLPALATPVVRWLNQPWP
jgi:2-polyprenyl-6-methoxyphenol hydroxylase-like FAD-dependent oxidoreductase